MNHAFDTIAIPIATEKDAEATCRAIRPFLSTRSEVVLVHVIEKAGGGIDPTSVEQRKRLATRAFDRCSQELSASAGTVDTAMTFHTDVVEGILEAARDSDADVIAFTPRSASRILKLVTGDTAFKLIHRAEHPVVVVPAVDDRAPDREGDE